MQRKDTDLEKQDAEIRNLESFQSRLQLLHASQNTNRSQPNGKQQPFTLREALPDGIAHVHRQTCNAT
eukprot:3378340-Rhodomonas_salina.2